MLGALAAALRFRAQDIAEEPDGPLRAFGFRFGVFPQELLADLGLAPRELGGDVGAGEGVEDLPRVARVERGDELEEGDVGDELVVLGVAGPFGEDNGIFGLEFGVRGDGVEQDDFAEVAV